jgi:hypothetical protein
MAQLVARNDTEYHHLADSVDRSLISLSDEPNDDLADDFTLASDMSNVIIDLEEDNRLLGFAES